MGLNLKNIGVELSGKPILGDVSCAFSKGKIHVVLGPNGAGKSTLLKTIAGLVSYSGGIELNGLNLKQFSVKQRARSLAYLPQNYQIAWDILVRDVIAMGRYAHDDSDPIAIEHAMQVTDTTRFAERTTGQLSGGELARVTLARVLAGKPDWILADEPLASLDPAYQLDMVTRFRDIAATGTAIIIVLHDINLAAKLADNVLMLKDGAVLTNGDAATALSADNLSKLYDISVKKHDIDSDYFVIG